ncbi:MAG: DNA-3-methyladenine glycosylase I, partial [Candidatus Limnocylindrales bacterium]
MEGPMPPDERVRCWWPDGSAAAEPLMVVYHDEEWGVPVSDDRVLFER